MTCISSFAYTAAAAQQASAIIAQATVDTAIQAAVALWQRNSSKSISNMQTELADLQMKLAEEVQAHAIQYYPREATLVNDAFGEAKVVTQYTALAGEWGGLLDQSMEAGRQTWIEVLDDACLSPDLCEDSRWQRNAQAAKADMLSYSSRQDESRTQILNDRRYARQLAVLGLGRGQLTNLLGYQQIGMTSGAEAGRMLLGTVNSALQAYGYYPARDVPSSGWGARIAESWGVVRAPDPMARVVSNVVRERLDQPGVDIAPIGRINTQPLPSEMTKANEINMAPDLDAERAALRRGEI